MKRDALVFGTLTAGVVVGALALLVGEAAHGGGVLVPAGGGLVLLSVGGLTLAVGAA